jgi:hypothetical protein
MHFVFFCEPSGQLFTMLIDPPNQIVRYADIERTADFVGKDVDVVVTRFSQADGSGSTGSPAFAGDDTEQAIDTIAYRAKE